MVCLQAADEGNITSRLALKPKATHNMEWFLNNIYPELNVPDRDSFAWGWVSMVAHSGPYIYPKLNVLERYSFTWDMCGFSTISTLFSVPTEFHLPGDGQTQWLPLH